MDPDDLARLPVNAGVLRRVAGLDAHGDLSEVLVRYAGDLHVVWLGAGLYPAVVAARPSGEIVACAQGMRHLGLRAGHEAPAGARLHHEPAPELGPGWWHVNPFDAAVSRDDTAAELRRWFARAARD